jgi:hypothetical protein
MYFLSWNFFIKQIATIPMSVTTKYNLYYDTKFDLKMEFDYEMSQLH